ncbi:sulfatase-like hydrolase/transferase [Roseibacillus ishigakijimensis]|uniref:Sulfatase-like hydrolase/transferase n=1 Tax=Roseibacillus ishigakijimensis TaxID=454146 RepID=A0A934VLE2_9BACT|nr:sulfatase-like hydrolase/transferase [Roseibacillus ishigakijimensis]MBK1833147.1 sulfatase-like hydrolase/transferase [Roseibacillus ishigakijimensis]
MFSKIPFLSSLAGLVGLVAGPVALAGERPNFLFILVDDQSPYDLTIYDPQSPLETPHLSRLAEQGVVFEGAYQMGSWSGAVCTPSRTMIMTGRGVWNIPGAWKETRQEDTAGVLAETLPALFNAHGYDTMRTCKKGNSFEAANKQFTVRRDATKRGGTAESGSAWHGQQVLDYLATREESQDEDPFLIYFGFSHPHDVRDGTPPLLEKYGASNHTDPANPPQPGEAAPSLQTNYLPAHPFPHGHPGLRDEEKVSGVWKRRDEATVRNELGREYACSENIDIQIGKVLARLEEMGELDNTYIIYTSDHGMSIGRHGLMGKQNLYEHTWRVPYIVSGPGLPAGKRVPGNIYLMDTLPTLLDLAGIAAPEALDGVSFRPVLQGEKSTVREVLYGVYTGGTKPGMRSVRRGDWKLIKYDTLDGQVRQTQLFNLAENPQELLAEHHDPAVVALTGNKPGKNQRNLAYDPDFADKRKEMEALLLREQERWGDPYRLWDQPQP